DRQDRQQPERRQLRLSWVRETYEPGRGEETPRSYSDEVEDADDLVCRGVRRTLLVAVVEAVELRGQHPGREHQDEDRCSLSRSDRVACGAGEDQHRPKDRCEPGDDVSG